MKKFIKFLSILIIIYAIYFITSGSFIPKFKENEIAEKSLSKEIDINRFYSKEKGVDKASIITDREDGLSLRYELLDKAKKSVDISYYLIDNDISGDLFLGKITELADRGVKVRILMSKVSSDWSKENIYKTVAMRSHENIEFKYYGEKNLLKPWIINDINHDKIIIVDDEYFMTSGRNISDRFFIGHNEKIVFDMDILIKRDLNKSLDSSVVKEAKDYFDEIWNCEKSYYPIENIDEYFPQKITNSKKIVKEKYNLAKKSMDNLLNKNIIEKVNFIATNKISLIHNPVNNLVKEPDVWMTISKFLNNAEKRALIQTPYFVLDSNMQKFIDFKNIENIDLDVITNSLASSPNLPAFSAYLFNKKDYLNYGNFYEYQSIGSIHSKAVLIDDDISMIGSFNIDPRSSFLSTENMVVINGDEFNKELESTLEYCKNKSLLAKTKKNYIESDNVEPKKSLPTKRFIYTFLSPLAEVFKHLI